LAAHVATERSLNQGLNRQHRSAAAGQAASEPVGVRQLVLAASSKGLLKRAIA
jgi:hypothetical protein